MPTLEFTQKQLNAYLAAIEQLEKCDYDKDPNLPDQNDAIDLNPWPAILHAFYRRCCWHCNEMRVHADGLFPAKLLKERRPNESDEVYAYRSLVYEAKTKPTFNKVYTSLQKIRRSPDWSIRFDNKKKFTRIEDDGDLEAYTSEYFPYFNSLTNWVFTVLLRKYLIDPNAVVFMGLLSYEPPELSERVKPFPYLFGSEDVLDFASEDYVVLNNPEGCTYYVKSEVRKGKSLYIITTEKILKYDQQDAKNNFALVLDYDHGLGMLPAFKLKGILVDQAGSQFMYESKISGMLPELNEAVREYSDLQAGKVMHLYPERWQFSNLECPTCKGRTVLQNPLYTPDCGCPAELVCHACHGSGVMTSKGPYSKILIKPGNTIDGQNVVPNPPAGYIEKDVETIKYQDTSVEKHIYDALAAINFQFMADVPLSQSGVAKATDRDESNNFTHSIAEDLVCAMDESMKLIAIYRYKDQYSIQDIEDDMLPTIAVPDNYDILYIGTAEKELADAKTNKINPVILNAMEVDYAAKRFNADPEVRDRLVLILKLDPLPNISDDSKMVMLSNKGISQETYVISSNIQAYVQRALDEDKGFADKDLKDQKAIMVKYAQEQIKAESAAAKVVQLSAVPSDQFNQNPQDPNNPQPPNPNKPPVIKQNANV